MIVSRAPLRVSFAGGGSDLPAYFMNSEEPGMVVSAAIQKYVYVILNKKFDDGVRVSYSKTENVRYVSELKHDIVRETLKYFGVSRGIEVVTVADVPGRGTGLGSSSALAVALIKALAKYTNRYYTPYDCAKLACEIEIEKCGHPIGYQDQFASAFGGLNTIEFRKREVRVDRITPTGGLGNLERNLVLFWLGTRKGGDEILKEQNDRLKNGNITRATRDLIILAKEFETDLWANNLDNFGARLNRAWEIKKSLSTGISDSRIEKVYLRAIESGACGAKVLGAGGGGFLLVFAHPDRHKMIQSALSMRSIPVNIDIDGVKIVEQR